jgi:hypothetical protein
MADYQRILTAVDLRAPQWSRKRPSWQHSGMPR